MTVIELFGVAALVALGAVALVIVAVLVRDPRPGEDPPHEPDDREAMEAGLAEHGVRLT